MVRCPPVSKLEESFEKMCASLLPPVLLNLGRYDLVPAVPGIGTDRDRFVVADVARGCSKTARIGVAVDQGAVDIELHSVRAEAKRNVVPLAGDEVGPTSRDDRVADDLVALALDIFQGRVGLKVDLAGSSREGVVGSAIARVLGGDDQGLAAVGGFGERRGRA